MSEDEIPLDKLAKVYIRIRDAVQAKTKEFETEIEGLKEQMDQVKHLMKDRLLAQGATSSKTSSGTIILSQKTRYYAQDWDAMKQFIREHDALDLFEKRLAQTNMKQYLEQNPGVVPPGLQSQTEYDVAVRKPTAK
jgi:hypothetical protein